jgi:hypothetical protein
MWRISLTGCAVRVNTVQKWTVDLGPLSYHVTQWQLATA